MRSAKQSGSHSRRSSSQFPTDLIFNCKYYTEFRFEIKCAANAPRFRWGRCSSPQCYRAPRDSRRHICRVTCRRGETPHLLESSLIAICDRASKGKYHNETPTVHKTPSLPLRPMLRAHQPSVSAAAKQDVSPPQGNTGPLHGDAASSRVLSQGGGASSSATPPRHIRRAFSTTEYTEYTEFLLSRVGHVETCRIRDMCT